MTRETKDIVIAEEQEADRIAAFDIVTQSLNTHFQETPEFRKAAALMGYTLDIAQHETSAITDSFKNKLDLLSPKKYWVLQQAENDFTKNPERYYGGIFLAKRIAAATDRDIDSIVIKGMKEKYLAVKGMMEWNASDDIFGKDTSNDLWTVLTELKKRHDADKKKTSASAKTFMAYETLYNFIGEARKKAVLEKIKTTIEVILEEETSGWLAIERAELESRAVVIKEGTTVEESTSFSTIAGLFKAQMPRDITSITQSLAVAAFGANLDGEKRFDGQGRKEGVGEILNKYKGKPEILKKLISTEATITLSPNAQPDDMIRPCIPGEVLKVDAEGKPIEFTRTATVLEFAMRCSDEEMTGIIKKMMDEIDPEWASTEFSRQSDKVFGPNYGCNPNGIPRENGVPAKNGFLKEQETQAKALFTKADIAVFTESSILVKTPFTQKQVDDFKRLLSEYIKDAGTDIHRLAHNPYIFQIAIKIYEVLPYDGSTEHHSQLCLFSQQIIGESQNSMKKTSHLWLKHSAESIYYRAQKIEAARTSSTSIPPYSRSFVLQDPEGRDVRSFSGLGDSAFIGMFGCAGGALRVWRWVGAAWERAGYAYQKLCQTKTSHFQNLRSSCNLAARRDLSR